MRVLVTGATGLIGEALVRRFVAEGAWVVAAVHRPEYANTLFADEPRVEVVAWDVTHEASISGDVDYLVHAAAETASKAFVERPVEVIRTIVDGMVNVLEFAKAKRVKGMVFLSTMEVYGSPKTEFVAETDFGALDSASVRSSYPEAKRLAESLCVAYAREYGVPVTIARLAQTFGEGVRKDDQRVFAQFARAVDEGRDIVLHTRGDTARCYCHIGDAVEAVCVLLRAGVHGEAYNVANPETFCTIRKMAEMLAASHPPCKVVYDLGGAEGRGYAPTLRMPLTTDKLEALGWKPHVGLEEMFERMLAFWKKTGKQSVVKP